MRYLLLSLLLGATGTAQTAVELRVTSEFVTDGPGREILSPWIPRNGWSKFHLAIAAPALTEFKLWVGLNPDDAIEIEVSRDGRAVELPYSSVIPPGAKPLILAMRFRAAKDAVVRRIKVEPEIWVENRWVTYPMEVRIGRGVVPDGVPEVGSWQTFFCGSGSALAFPQDILLAKSWAPSNVRDAFEKALGRPIAQWCADGALPSDPEWYLKFRDWLIH